LALVRRHRGRGHFGGVDVGPLLTIGRQSAAENDRGVDQSAPIEVAISVGCAVCGESHDGDAAVIPGLHFVSRPGRNQRPLWATRFRIALRGRHFVIVRKGYCRLSGGNRRRPPHLLDRFGRQRAPRPASHSSVKITCGGRRCRTNRNGQ